MYIIFKLARTGIQDFFSKVFDSQMKNVHTVLRNVEFTPNKFANSRLTFPNSQRPKSRNYT